MEPESKAQLRIKIEELKEKLEFSLLDITPPLNAKFSVNVLL